MPEELDLPDEPGVKTPKVPAIAKALDDWIPKKDKRVAASVHERGAKATLLEAFHRHADKLPKDEAGALLYRHDGKLYKLLPGKETLKVEDDDDGDDD